jgi:hypothetical protein
VVNLVTRQHRRLVTLVQNYSRGLPLRNRPTNLSPTQYSTLQVP